MSAVMPNEVFAPSDLEALQGYPQHSSNNKFAADPIKSNPSTPTQTTASATDSSEDTQMLHWLRKWDTTIPPSSIWNCISASVETWLRDVKVDGVSNARTNGVAGTWLEL
ncbi:uncharacterized protein TNIN_415821 [Trichonephila inaurata madagascariensis]|uniref:Uncharacterized protein n=1 Tax=Trichonephila inaurata madagascariensis TaxID=2747483 RepID=A0A8X6X180_9ARAC|nr:uncharacterized protein TNIN_415821 [Trichonephila inaurata madagascariensis]